MNTIEKLTQLNYLVIILGFFVMLFAAKEIIEILGYFKKKFRIKTGADDDKSSIENRIKTLENHDTWQYDEIVKISNGIKEIKSDLFDTKIENMRKTILDFCSLLSGGGKPNRETFQYIFRIYEKYDELLLEHHMKNGVIEESMKYISEKYQEFLSQGIL